MTTALDRKSAYAGIIERAETIVEASAQGAVAKAWMFQWVQAGREPGRRLINPCMFAVYNRLREDDRSTPARIAPVSFELSADDLRAPQDD